jgi:hypothetical protein
MKEQAWTSEDWRDLDDTISAFKDRVRMRHSQHDTYGTQADLEKSEARERENGTYVPPDPFNVQPVEPS